MDRIVIHTNRTNTVRAVRTLGFDDLIDAAQRDLLRAALTDPTPLRPE